MKEMLVILIIIIGIVALYISYKRLKKRCESCGIWGAMKIVDREIIEKRKSHIVKTLKDKNSKGEVIRTREKAVPATTITYLVTEKCKHCASEEKYYKDETTEN